eukprot:1158568-Pelagomonas_calceolata.AAC.4
MCCCGRLTGKQTGTSRKAAMSMGNGEYCLEEMDQEFGTLPRDEHSTVLQGTLKQNLRGFLKQYYRDHSNRATGSTQTELQGTLKLYNKAHIKRYYREQFWEVYAQRTARAGQQCSLRTALGHHAHPLP